MGQEPEKHRDHPRRLGIFGGTFDPPHNGHLSVATDVADTLGLDEVLWVPARRSPHKPDAPLTSDAIRLKMCEAAIGTEPRFRVGDLELRRPAPSFTIDSLRELRAEEPEAEFFLLLGFDQYESFDQWEAPDEIRAMVTLVVMDRGGMSALPDDLPGMLRVPVGRVDVSSSDVRERVRAGVDIADVVPPGVAQLIESERLYLD
jgi:nicotinate-nucleotide adenylyltransferase